MENNLLELRKYLEKEYNTKLSLNSSYSKRAFSRDLGVSPTCLNDFLAGRRDLNLKNIDKIFKYLGKKSAIRCSWCDKDKKDAKYIIGGTKRLFICDSCVATCNNIIAKTERRIDQRRYIE